MRAKRLIATLTMIAAALLLPIPQAGAGGGSWLMFEGQDPNSEPVLAWGEHVHATAGLSLNNVVSGKRRGGAWAGPDQGPFFGYIAARKDVNWGPFPPPLPDDAVLVGQVVFSKTSDSRVMDLTLDFVMPELEPGYYSLLHCNDPCTRQIGDTMSTAFTVVEDRGQVFVASVVNRIDRTLVGVRARALDLRGRARNLKSDVTLLENQVDTLKDRVDSLEQAAASASRRDSAPSPSAFPWALVATVFAAALMFAFTRGGKAWVRRLIALKS